MSALGISHWSLGIPWSLVVGHWSFPISLRPATNTSIRLHLNRTGHQLRSHVNDPGERLPVLEFEHFQPKADRIAGRGCTDCARGHGADQRRSTLCLSAL